MIIYLDLIQTVLLFFSGDIKKKSKKKKKKLWKWPVNYNKSLNLEIFSRKSTNKKILA